MSKTIIAETDGVTVRYCPTGIDEQLTDLRNPADRVHDFAISRPMAEWVRASLIYIMDLYGIGGPPFLYATEDGDVRAEWETSLWEIVLRFIAESGNVHLTAVHQERDEMREAEVCGHASRLLEPLGAQVAELLAEMP